jgi:hypothetical protein
MQQNGRAQNVAEADNTIGIGVQRLAIAHLDDEHARTAWRCH